ncbi:MAG: DUF3859 domain-containing protein [Proteobacteria bacterium]|nr:DUF3859 domain-containing protein [Pseudomonadota bacterium]
MTKLFFSCLVLCLANLVHADELRVNAAEIVGYGIFDTSSTVPGRRFTASSIAQDNVKGVRFIEYTTDIPAQLGLNFGIQYVINSSPRGQHIRLTSVVKFPQGGLQRPRGRLYAESRDTHEVAIGRKVLHGYGFDEEWEMVPGTWIFELWYRDARLIKKTFNVYLPDVAKEADVVAPE